LAIHYPAAAARVSQIVSPSDDDALNTLKQITGRNFEVVKMGPITQ